ncbi:MAG: efflux RND transporter periplasmic adaptor subunit [Cycloclasticus sp.]|nr:efflux RND transporter periplasmic adaptor subunit [Cycloclasticus sp.]
MNILKSHSAALRVTLFSVLVVMGGISFAAEDNGHDEHEAAEEQSVKLTVTQLEMAGIEVSEIQPEDFADEINAPGEVVLNAYKTTFVTPRVASQVVARHVKLGDVIKTGEPLVTLSSVEMAAAQGDLLVSGREWQRVKQLGSKVVSGQRYTNARVTYEQAKARVLAYGMTLEELESLMKSGDASKANGTFQLLAPQDGTIISDQFIVGELIQPGTKLFTISDESVLWVEAKLTPSQARLVRAGGLAMVTTGDNKFPGTVVQVHHALDEDTRTLGVRIAIANPDDQLHPGVFAEVQINSMNTVQALVVPVDSVLRSPDGDWAVFLEHEKGEFVAQEVELIKTQGGLAVIEGIKPGTRVVTKGAFFIQSELAKAGFDIHNH